MKTINELGIYFMCCFIFATLFITYLAVKLRAYRIKNAKLINRIEISDKDIADAYESLDKETNKSSHYWRKYVECYRNYKTHRTESAAIINQSAENNAKLVLEIETLKSDRQKLFERVQELKRDKRILHSMAKGATDKLAEMNVALEGLEVKEEKDWSKEPFPQGYEIPKGTICKSIKSTDWLGRFKTPKGMRLRALESSFSPFLEHLKGGHRHNYDNGLQGYCDACIDSKDLAPLNPLDHPNHPNFRG